MSTASGGADAGGASGESDVLKIYVYGMLAVTLIFGGVVWYVQKRTDELERAVDWTRGNPEKQIAGVLPKLAQAKKMHAHATCAYSAQRFGAGP